MRLAILLLLSAAALAAAQDTKKGDRSKIAMEVTGCVRGSLLTESNLRGGVSAHESPMRRWRVRGPKALMNQIKEHAGRELQIRGTTRSPESMVIAGRRIGKTNIYIGGDPARTSRDPLPEPPTIEVESFEATGERCEG